MKKKINFYLSFFTFFIVVALVLFQCSSSLKKQETSFILKDTTQSLHEESYNEEDFLLNENANIADVFDFDRDITVKNSLTHNIWIKVALDRYKREVLLFNISGGVIIYSKDNNNFKPVMKYKPNKEEQFRFVSSGNYIIGYIGNRRIIFKGDVWVHKVDSNFFIGYGKYFYRGDFIIKNTTKGLIAINYLDIEDYLKGVVPNEIGRLSKRYYEVLKVQSIIARTYTLSKLFSKDSIIKKRGYHLVATIYDQVYRGISSEYPLTNKAVEETRGLILTYNNKPIVSYYHSACGGATARISDVWTQKKDLPYLINVIDTIGGDYACRRAYRFSWKKEYNWGTLISMLRKNLKLNIYSLEDIKIIKRTPFFRVKVLRIYYNKSDSIDIYGDKIRWVFKDKKGQGLYSTFFDLYVKKDIKVTFKGRGYGHGVGLCQHGAIKRALMGWKMKKILFFYYKDVKLQKIY